MDELEFVAERVDPVPSIAKNQRDMTEEGRRMTEELAAVKELGYWEVVRQRMARLFRELDWEELRGLGADARIAHVKSWAEERFATTRDEAFCRRYP